MNCGWGSGGHNKPQGDPELSRLHEQFDGSSWFGARFSECKRDGQTSNGQCEFLNCEVGPCRRTRAIVGRLLLTVELIQRNTNRARLRSKREKRLRVGVAAPMIFEIYPPGLNICPLVVVPAKSA